MIIKEGKTNTKYLLIVVVLAVVVGGIIYWQYRMMQKEESGEKELNLSKEKLPGAQLILSDEEVYEILKEYASRKVISFPDTNTEAEKILLDVLESTNGTIEQRLSSLGKKIEELSEILSDSPDARSFMVIKKKKCLAEGIIYGDLKHICDIEEDSSLNLSYVDDILASEIVLPFFVSGFAYYTEGDYFRADYYLNQIKLHRQAGIEFWDDFGESYFLEVAGDIYEKIYNKTMKMSPEKVGEEARD